MDKDWDTQFLRVCLFGSPKEELEFPVWNVAQAQEFAFTVGEERRKAGKNQLILGRDAQCGTEAPTLTRT